MTTTAISLACIALQAAGAPAGWPSWLPPPTPGNLVIWACVLVLLALVFLKLRGLPSHLRARDKSTLDPVQMEALMIGTPPQIVDLRPREEYMGEDGHIRGALNIPFGEFKERIGELDTSHPRPIVLVDESDKLSHQVMPLLEARGHRWLYVLKGGYRAWKKAKFPTYSTPGAQKQK